VTAFLRHENDTLSRFEIEHSFVFTGIVETAGELIAREESTDGLRLRIAADSLDDLHHGQSIAVSGVCLTVEAFGTVEATGDERAWFEVFCAAETVAKTYLDELAVGDAVNVERALPADGRFDGHLVQGHVDTTTTITSIERVGEDWRFGFDVPAGFGQYVVGKGSVALDGISLTVAERHEASFEVAIIPTTYELTNLSEKSVGDPVHLEVDVVAKYVESMLDGYTVDHNC
jgi:riboflavin synthase